MKKLEEITAEEILQEFIVLDKEYSPTDRTILLEGLESFRVNLLHTVKNKQPLASVSLNKTYYRGRRTIAILKAIGVKEIPRSIKEVANIFSELYVDEEKASRMEQLKTLLKLSLADRDLRDPVNLNDAVDVVIGNLKQHGFLYS